MSMHTRFNKTLEGNWIICDCYEAEIIKYFWHLNLHQLTLISKYCPNVAEQRGSLRGKLTFDQRRLIRSRSQERREVAAWVMGGGCYWLITLLSRCLRIHKQEGSLRQAAVVETALKAPGDILISSPPRCTDKPTLFLAFFCGVKRGRLKTSWQAKEAGGGDRNTVNMKTLFGP